MSTKISSQSFPKPRLKRFLTQMKKSGDENLYQKGHRVVLSDRDEKALMAQLKVKEYSDKLAMRTQWSYFLMSMVAISIGFQIILIVLVGSRRLSFSDAWLARLLFPGIFGEILGLVYIIIRYLFPVKLENSKLKPAEYFAKN